MIEQDLRIQRALALIQSCEKGEPPSLLVYGLLQMMYPKYSISELLKWAEKLDASTRDSVLRKWAHHVADQGDLIQALDIAVTISSYLLKRNSLKLITDGFGSVSWSENTI